MDLTTARRTKAELRTYSRELLARRVEASTTSTAGVSLGLAPLTDGGFGLAVRYRLGVPTARMVARRVAEQAGPGVDVRRTGRIRAVPPVAARRGGVGGPRPPVVTAQALGETGRVRPLRPGVSIGHVDVSAGS